MLIYEVKLIHPQTKETLYLHQGPRPQLPTPDMFQQHPGALLIITTRDFFDTTLTVNPRVA